MEYVNSRCNTLWFGQIEGHIQSVASLMIHETLTYQEKHQIVMNLMYIASSCEAITKQLKETKELPNGTP